MLAFSIIILLMWAFLYFFSFFTNIRFSDKGLLGIWYLFVFGLALFSFYAEPSMSDDLYRHYELIDILRSGGTLQYTYAEYMIVFRMMLWIAAKTPYNGFLPFITILIWGWAIGRVIKKYMSESGAIKQSVLLYYMIVIGGCPTFYLISGIRTALTLALVIYAYYCHFRERHYIKFAIIVFLTITIHYISLLFTGLLLLYKFAKSRNSMKTKILLFINLILLAIFVNTNFFINILAQSDSLYLSMLRTKWIDYIGASVFNASMFVEYSLKIIMLMVLTFSSFIALPNDRRSDSTILFNLFLIFTIIAMFRMSIIFVRLPYAIAILSLPTIDKCIKKMKQKARIGYCLTGIAFFSLQALYMFYAMLYFINFGGVNFQDVLHNIL